MQVTSLAACGRSPGAGSVCEMWDKLITTVLEKKPCYGGQVGVQSVFGYQFSQVRAASLNPLFLLARVIFGDGIGNKHTCAPATNTPRSLST